MQTLNYDQLKKLSHDGQSDFVLINVLDRSNFISKHIRTSVNVPVSRDDFVDQVADITADKERMIVVYCANFDCDASTKAAKKLEQAGFKNVFDYEGGTEDWIEHKRAA